LLEPSERHVASFLLGGLVNQTQKKNLTALITNGWKSDRSRVAVKRRPTEFKKKISWSLFYPLEFLARGNEFHKRKGFDHSFS
jgi:hypothetical protein